MIDDPYTLDKSKDCYAFSTTGCHIISNDKESIDTIRKWHHEATARLPWFEREYRRMVNRQKELISELQIVLDKLKNL